MLPQTIFLPLVTLSLFLGACKYQPEGESQATGLGVRSVGGNNLAALGPCPTSPNCVTSYAHDGQSTNHFAEPFKVQQNKKFSREKILRLLLLDQANLVLQTDDYIHATYSSKVFSFVDDLELHFPNDEWVHFRSASRNGYYDFGINRKRVELLRHRYEQVEEN